MFKIPETYNHTYCKTFHTSFDKSSEHLYLVDIKRKVSG